MDVRRNCRLRRVGLVPAVLLVWMLTANGALAAGNGGAGGLDGTYRFTITDADLRAFGVPPRYFRLNHGQFTWVVHGGRWHAHQVAADPGPSDFVGLYTSNGDTVTFVFRVPGAPQMAPAAMTMRWKLAGGRLRFTVLGGGDAIVRTMFTAHPWRKLG